MRIRLTHLDGKLPNLALMKLAHYYKSIGAEIYFTRSVHRELFEKDYDLVLGSAIFKWSVNAIQSFLIEFPEAVVCGTGTDSLITVEQYIGREEYEHYDYSIYPYFQDSIGFTQRGCRLKCPFCVVPRKEGKVRGVNTIYNIWRGPPYPKNVHLLDNDFFGQPFWNERCKEILEGDFKICLNQGINVRLIHKEGAEALAKIKYYDDQFKTRRIYTAWDNRKDEKIFIRGIGMLTDAGIRPSHIMVYMLCGYWPNETFEDVYYRYETMKKLGVLSFPMVYDNSNKLMKHFQRWVIRRFDEVVSWEDYRQRKMHEIPPQNAIPSLEMMAGGTALLFQE